MKKTALIAVLGLTAMLSAASAQQVKVGIAFDAGGKFDHSFNESAWNGAKRAEKDFKILLKDFEPSDPSQVVSGIRSFAQNGFDLTLAIGFANNASITSVAKENNDLAFGLIDDVSEAKNVQSVTFKEQEGSYLVGYIAGLSTSTGVVGFIGGMDIPLIHKFEAGFTAGVKAANPKAKVIAQYVGTTPQAWNDPAKAKEIAGTMKARGTDIIYGAAGASGNGLIDFVKTTQCIKKSQLPKGVAFSSDLFKNVPKSEGYRAKCTGDARPMFFIGVDSDQTRFGDTDSNSKTLNHGLTSMLKRVDNAVYSIIKGVVTNTFKGGGVSLGLKEGGVGYAVSDYNRALLPQSLLAKVEKAKAAIIAGKVSVPEK
ncbi:BMP family lipoprotein [Deinococcus roseus]|uniref:Membrane protein n=1 Tax=Deinococcus roseus TaxID=392414 RepID=A0ABQ2CYD9_9DEIO|nr:BMP family ABC transporter substrate-binding protein [Deinococcus roseus]GGJ33007.1 membrane protein [Deinococcus roseus]